MELQQLYTPRLHREAETQRSRSRWLSLLLTAAFLAAIGLCVGLLWRHTALCTALCLGLCLAAYGLVGIVLGVRRQRLEAYCDFFSDMEEGLAQESIGQVLRREAPQPDPRYGLELYALEILRDGKPCRIWSPEALEVGRSYAMQTVGAYLTAVESYEN